MAKKQKADQWLTLPDNTSSVHNHLCRSSTKYGGGYFK